MAAKNVDPADLQAAKKVVQDFYNDLDSAQTDARSIEAAFQTHCTSDYHWRGMHPFYEIPSASEVVERFWGPLKRSLVRIQRRQDVFMAGNNFCEGEVADQTGKGDGAEPGTTVWTMSMGNLMGIFENNWLEIPATGKMAFLRYAEFTQVSKKDNKIMQTAMFIDIPHLMVQAGCNPFPPATGASVTTSTCPMTHTGLMMESQDPEESQKTLDIINDMIGNCMWKLKLTLEEELAINWHDDMIWWGPAGIGASYTIKGYAKGHSGPFRAAFKDRGFNGHVCRMAEGEFGGFFGWPNLKLTPVGGFMGMGTKSEPCYMRVVDIYRRKGDKLAENWVFIDLLYFWKQQGLDILDRMKTYNAVRH